MVEVEDVKTKMKTMDVMDPLHWTFVVVVVVASAIRV
jgi:hypothetical protein